MAQMARLAAHSPLSARGGADSFRLERYRDDRQASAEVLYYSFFTPHILDQTLPIVPWMHQ